MSLEEIHGSFGFSGAYSRKMHLRCYPTVQAAAPTAAPFSFTAECPGNAPLEPFHIRTANIPYQHYFEKSRPCLFKGPTTALSVSKPRASTPADEFFRNGEAHECLFVQEGEGILASEYGELRFCPRRYLIVPKGTTYQVRLQSPRAFFFIVESLYPIHFAPHYLNAHGQATLMAPVVETEIETPRLQGPRDQKGRFVIWTKHGGGRITKMTLGHHPFDLVGWEGALYPFAFDAENHHSIAREIHTAPPVRQTFQSGQVPYNGFSICTFRAQVEGWHPKDVPAPYAHYNADSDEAMFFSDASYGARSGLIEPGSLTFHPGGLPHSPHGAAARNSLKTRGKLSRYLAVMLDTFFESLAPTVHVEKFRDKDYALSWAKLR